MKKMLIFFAAFAMMSAFAVAEDVEVANEDETVVVAEAEEPAAANEGETPAVAEVEEPPIVGTWKLSKYEWTFYADGTGVDQAGDALTWTTSKKGYTIKLKKVKVAAKKIEDGKMVTNIGIFKKQ